MKINKLQNKIISIVFALALIVASTPAFASTISLSSSNVSVKKGDIVKIIVSADSQGSYNYTFKSSVNFPSDLLSVDSWDWSEGWIPVAQVGYDELDNTNGVIVRTAGYGGGIMTSKEFGVITFVAKKSGQGTISVDKNESFILNVDGDNTYK